MNAVLVNGDAVGQTMFYGPGAGSEPTASAVIADIVKVARLVGEAPHNHVPHLGVIDQALTEPTLLGHADIETAYYIRLSAQDKPGVLSKISQALSDGGISIEALIQKPPKQDEDHVPVIILTNKTIEQNMLDSIKNIESLDSVVGNVTKIRVEDFQ